MRPVCEKHPLADDTIFRLKTKTRVRLYGKENGCYIVIQVNNGKQWEARKEDFLNPELLPF